MKRILLTILLLVIWSTVQAGTVYDLTNQLSPAGTPGLDKRSKKLTMTPLHRFIIGADNRTTTSSWMLYSKQTWTSAFDSLLDIDGASGAGSIDASQASMLHSLGETTFVDILDDGGPQTHTRLHNFTIISRDTVSSPVPSTARFGGSWYLPGDSMIVICDEDLATDSTTMQLSNGQVSNSTVWTEIQNDARDANAGAFLPVYDGVGQSRYGLKWDANTDDVIIYTRTDGATTVATALTGIALTTPGYAAHDIVHLAGDTFAVAYQKALTGTKDFVARPFYVTWSGTTPNGIGYNASEQTIVASASVPDNFRVAPAFSGIHGRRDSLHLYYRLGTTSPDGVYRISSYDGGRTWGSAVKEIDTSETTDDKFWMLQAPPAIASSSGTQYLGLAWSDSATSAGSCHLYAWTDTLYTASTTPSNTGRSTIKKDAIRTSTQFFPTEYLRRNDE